MKKPSPEFWSAISAIAAATSAVFAFLISQSANEIALKSQVGEQMSRYLSAYSSTADSLNDPFTLGGYLALNPKDRARVQVVAGMQIVLVDLMFDAHDPLKEKWLKFIAIPGPTACSDLLSYSRRKETTLFLSNAISKFKERRDFECGGSY